MQENPTAPYALVLVSNILTAILSVAGTLTTLWFKRRREPAEIRRIDAETRNLIVTTEIASTGSNLELLREIQAVIKKAEDRSEAWHLKEEQMRTQIVFWRNKAEELDGELADSRQANGLLEARYRNKSDSLDKAMALLKLHQISYSEMDHPKN